MKHAYLSLLPRWVPRPLAALGLLLATTGAAYAQAPTFAPVVTYASGGSQPYGLAAGDVNGDGRPDLVTINGNSFTVAVLLGSSTSPGTFSAPTTYPSGGTFGNALSVALGDVNGDGRLDVVATNPTDNTVGVLLNSATAPGTFGPVTTYSTGSANGPRVVALGDVNGDGRLDIATAAFNAGSLSILLNSATTPGTFGAPINYSTGGSSTTGVALGDLNGDGRLDAVTLDRTTSDVAVFVNQAAAPGTFGTPAKYSIGISGSSPFGLTLGDLNGDNRLDVITANLSNPTVSVLLNSATVPGMLQTATTYPSGGTNPIEVAVSDLNGDGRADIAVSNYGSNQVGVLLNSATTPGTFAAPVSFSTGASSAPRDLVLTDLNADGRRDIATANYGSNTVGVLLSTTVFATPTLTSLSPTSGPVGTSVTLMGTNLSGATAVSFNGTAATTFAVVNATTLTATVPTGASTGNVTVTTPSGTSNGVAFTVTSAPTVTTAAPSNVGPTDAVLGGTVTADGGAPATERGVVYSSTNAAPTIGGAGTTKFASGSTGTGSYSLPVGGLAPGTTYYVRAYAINSAGTSYGPALSFTTTQATTAAPVLTDPANNRLVATTTPTYSGTALAGSTVTVYVDGLSRGTTTATNGGTFSLLQPTALTQGPHTVYATAQLSGQLASANSNTNTFTVDTVAPTVTITSPTAPNGGYTTTSPLTFIVTFSEAVIGYNITSITRNISNVAAGSFNATNAPTYTVILTPAAPGAVTLSVPAGIVTDAAGNGNAAAVPQTYTIYYNVPTTAPVLTNPANNSTTPSNLPTYQGTAPAGSTVTVYVDGASIGTATASNGGSFSLTQSTVLTQGPHTVYATAQLSGQAVSANSNTNTFTVASAPTITLFSPATGPVGTQVTITGTNLSGATAVRFNGTAASSFVVNSATSITAVVAAGTTTGLVTVTTPSGTATSTTNFVVRVAPITVADAYTTPQNVTLTGNVLTNDIGTNPQAILIIRPTHGTLLLNPNGTFTYQPTAGYVGTDSFIYYACNMGTPLVCGDPATVSITVTPATPSLVAAKPAAPNARGTVATDAPAAQELALTGHPNPFRDELRLSFALPTAQAYTLAVYDAQGRLVQQLASGQAEAGQVQELVVPTYTYATSLYLVRLTTTTGTQLLKLLKQ
jgi:hypothetical protein